MTKAGPLHAFRAQHTTWLIRGAYSPRRFRRQRHAVQLSLPGEGPCEAERPATDKQSEETDANLRKRKETEQLVGWRLPVVGWMYGFWAVISSWSELAFKEMNMSNGTWDN